MKKNIIFILIFLSLISFGQEYNGIISHNGIIVSFNGNIITYPAYNSKAIALFQRMPTQPSTAIKRLYSIVYDTIDYYTILDSALLIKIYSTETRQQASLNLKGDYYNGLERGDLYFCPYVGFQSDQNISYINANIKPRDAGLSPNSITMANYIPTHSNWPGLAASSNRMSPMGVLPTSYTTNGILEYNLGYDMRLNNVFVNQTISPNTDINSTVGLFAFTRLGTSVKHFVGSTKVQDLTHAPISEVPNDSLYEFGINYLDGTLNNQSNHMIGFTYIGRNLSEMQVLKLNQIIDYWHSHLPNIEILYDTLNVQYKITSLENRPFPLIRYQRDDIKFASLRDSLYVSLDNGITWSYRYQFNDAERICMAYIYPNHEIVFATNRNEVYYSHDSLQTVTQSDVDSASGSSFVFHTPANSLYPGSYFKTLNDIEDATIGGLPYLVFGNYGNYYDGANPTILWYSADTGKTIVAGFEFGQNPAYTDNGTPVPGTGGTLLGDPTETELVRHIHFTTSYNDTIYFGTGDVIANNECKWYKAKLVADTFQVTELANANSPFHPRFKSADAQFIRGTDSIIFTSDGGAETSIFKAKINEIANTANHVTTYTSTVGNISSININNTTGKGIAGTFGGKNLILTTDNHGVSWSENILNHINIQASYTNPPSIGHIMKDDASGWYVIYPSIRIFPYSDEQGYYVRIK